LLQGWKEVQVRRPQTSARGPRPLKFEFGRPRDLSGIVGEALERRPRYFYDVESEADAMLVMPTGAITTCRQTECYPSIGDRPCRYA
jgi:hypothetical protein